jgi:hypothetical protein
MKKFFATLSAFTGLLLMSFSTFGQGIANYDFRETTVMLDSAITYNKNGAMAYKRIKVKTTDNDYAYKYFKWSEGEWAEQENGHSLDFTHSTVKPHIEKTNGRVEFVIPTMDSSIALASSTNQKYYVTFDERDNLVKFEFDTDYSRRIVIKYNEYDLPVSVEYTDSNNEPLIRVRYEYDASMRSVYGRTLFVQELWDREAKAWTVKDKANRRIENGNIVYHESHTGTIDGVALLDIKSEAVYSTDGRITLLNEYTGIGNGQWQLTYYTIFFYYTEDAPSTPSEAETIGTSASAINLANGTLRVNTSVSEQVDIYSVTGALLFNAAKTAGEAAYNVSALPKGIVIIKGTSGWVQKTVVK